MRYNCKECGWAGPIPGKGKICKKCGAKLDANIGADDREDAVDNPADVGAKAIASTPLTKDGRPIDEASGMTYELRYKGNPEVRKIDDKDSPRYTVIFRNNSFVKELRCPNCNKICAGNSRLKGTVDIICKKALPNGGGTCGSRNTFVFIQQGGKHGKKKDDEKKPVRRSTKGRSHYLSRRKPGRKPDPN